jgi:hypothetical protein
MTLRLRSALVFASIVCACVLIAGLRGGALRASTGAAYSGWYDFGFVAQQGVPCATSDWTNSYPPNAGILVVCQQAPIPFHGVYLSLGLSYNYQASSGVWGGWTHLSQPPAGAMGAPTMGRDYSGRLHVLVRATDSTLWENVLFNNTWSGWSAIGGALAGDPVAWDGNGNGAGHLFVFGRGLDGVLWAREANDQGQWQNWQSLGLPITTDRPVVTFTDQDEFEVVAVGSDGNIYAIPGASASLGPWGGFRTWESVGGPATTGIGAAGMTVGVTFPDGSHHFPAFVFWRGTDGTLWENWEDHTQPGHWHGPVSLGGQLLATPRIPPMVGINTDRTLEVFVMGLDAAVWHRYMLSSSQISTLNWSPFESLGGPLTSPGAIVTNSDGRLELVQEGTWGLYHKWQEW